MARPMTAVDALAGLVRLASWMIVIGGALVALAVLFGVLGISGSLVSIEASLGIGFIVIGIWKRPQARDALALAQRNDAARRAQHPDEADQE